jgi:hypothetical protein
MTDRAVCRDILITGAPLAWACQSCATSTATSSIAVAKNVRGIVDRGTNVTAGPDTRAGRSGRRQQACPGTGWHAKVFVRRPFRPERRPRHKCTARLGTTMTPPEVRSRQNIRRGVPETSLFRSIRNGWTSGTSTRCRERGVAMAGGSPSEPQTLRTIERLVTEALPPGWSLRARHQSKDRAADAEWTLRAPDGDAVLFAVEVKRPLTGRQVDDDARAARPRAWTSARSCAVPIPHASRHPRRPRRQLRRRDGERAPARRSTWALRRAPGRDEGSMAGRRRAQVPSRSSRWSSRPSAHRLLAALRRSRSRAARRRFPRLAVSNAGPP